MKKIIIIVLLLMVVLNVAVLVSSLNNNAEPEKESGISKSAKIELKEVNPLFFVNLLKF